MAKEKQKSTLLVSSLFSSKEECETLIRQRHEHYKKNGIETVFCIHEESPISGRLECYVKKDAPTKGRIKVADLKEILEYEDSAEDTDEVPAEELSAEELSAEELEEGGEENA